MSMSALAFLLLSRTLICMLAMRVSQCVCPQNVTFHSMSFLILQTKPSLIPSIKSVTKAEMSRMRAACPPVSHLSLTNLSYHESGKRMFLKQNVYLV